MIQQPSRLVVVGSVVGRLTLEVPNLPSKGSDVVASRRRLQAGGGYVVLASANNLGLPSVLCGRIGDGPFALLVKAALERAHIESVLDQVPGEQGFAVCAVENDGDRTFITMPGVESTLSPEDLARAAVGPQDAVLIQGFDLIGEENSDLLSRWCLDPAGLGSAMLVFDPGPLVADIPDDVLDRILGRCDVLVLGERELTLMAGLAEEADPGHASTVLMRSMGPDSVLLLRQRDSGVWVRRGNGVELFFPSHGTKETIDASVAADVFTGAFLAELARTGELEMSVQHATVATSITTPQKVDSESVTGPTREELNAALVSKLGKAE